MKIKQFQATFLAAYIFIFQCILAPAAENNLWGERRASFHPVSATIAQNKQRALQLPLSFSSIHKTSSNNHSIMMETIQKWGSLRSSKPSSNKKTVFYIQDIHENPEAQNNISQTILALAEQNASIQLLVEGAEGALPFQNFKSERSRFALSVVTTYLQHQNEITGAAAASLFSKNNQLQVLGIDDEKAYQQNIAAYRKSQQHKAAALKEWAQWNNEVLKKRQGLSPNLKNKLSDLDQYQSGQFSLSDLLRRWDSQESGFTPQLELFKAASEFEVKANTARIERERKTLLKNLSGRLSIDEMNGLHFLTQQLSTHELSYQQFYKQLFELCDRKRISVGSYPSLNNYVKYLQLVETIDSEKLLANVDQFIFSEIEKQIQSQAERTLVREAERVRLAQKLIDFSLSKKEWLRYRELKQSELLSVQTEPWTYFESFYAWADRRDQGMAAHVLRQLSSSKNSNAILVTGGYHSQGITKALEASGIDVVHFVPRVSKIEANGASNYLSVFAQEKSPLESLFEGQTLFLSKRPLGSRGFVGVASLLAGVMFWEKSTLNAQSEFSTFLRGILVADQTKFTVHRDKKGFTGTISSNGKTVSNRVLMEGDEENPRIATDSQSIQNGVLLFSWIPLQSWWGKSSWGLPSQYSWIQWGVIMPFVEEYLRYTTGLHFNQSLWWTVVGFSVLHVFLHLPVDFQEGKKKYPLNHFQVFTDRMFSRFVLSGFFGLFLVLLWPSFSETSVQWPAMLLAFTVHALSNVAAVTLNSKLQFHYGLSIPIMSVTPTDQEKETQFFLQLLQHFRIKIPQAQELPEGELAIYGQKIDGGMAQTLKRLLPPSDLAERAYVLFFNKEPFVFLAPNIDTEKVLRLGLFDPSVINPAVKKMTLCFVLTQASHTESFLQNLDTAVREFLRKKFPGAEQQLFVASFSEYLTPVEGHLMFNPQAVFNPEDATSRILRSGLRARPHQIVVDMFSGSGKAGLTQAVLGAGAVYLVDIDEVSAESEKFNTSLPWPSPVSAIRSNLFDSVPAELKGKVDLVLANPPMIWHEDKSKADNREHLISDPDLSITRKFAQQAHEWLSPGGRIKMAMFDHPILYRVMMEAGFEPVIIEGYEARDENPKVTVDLVSVTWVKQRDTGKRQQELRAALSDLQELEKNPLTEILLPLDLRKRPAASNLSAAFDRLESILQRRTQDQSLIGSIVKKTVSDIFWRFNNPLLPPVEPRRWAKGKIFSDIDAEMTADIGLPFQQKEKESAGRDSLGNFDPYATLDIVDISHRSPSDMPERNSILAKYFNTYLLTPLVPLFQSNRWTYILELGAGAGFLFEINRAAIEKLIGKPVTETWQETDLDPRTLNKSLSNLKRRTRVLDMNNLGSVPNDSIPAVVGLNSFHTLRKDQIPEFVRQLHRILKEGGNVIHVIDFLTATNTLRKDLKPAGEVVFHHYAENKLSPTLFSLDWSEFSKKWQGDTAEIKEYLRSPERYVAKRNANEHDFKEMRSMFDTIYTFAKANHLLRQEWPNYASYLHRNMVEEAEKAGFEIVDSGVDLKEERLVLPRAGNPLWNTEEERHSNILFIESGIGFTSHDDHLPKDEIRQISKNHVLHLRKKKTVPDDKAAAAPPIDYVLEPLKQSRFEADRTGVFSWNERRFALLEQANPGLRKKIMKVVATDFSKLIAGKDYEKVDGGRSVLIRLQVPVQLDGQKITAIKIKGASFSDSSEGYFNLGKLHENLGIESEAASNSRVKIVSNSEGRIVQSPRKKVPEGGAIAAQSLQEFDMNNLFLQRQFSAAISLAHVQYDRKTQEGDAFSCVIQGISDEMEVRTEKIVAVKADAILQQNAKNEAAADQVMKDTLRAQGRALRALHDKNLSHIQFNLSSTHIGENHVFYLDLESGENLSSMTEVQKLGALFLSLAKALISTNQVKKQKNSFWKRFSTNYMYEFLIGYFHDAENPQLLQSLKNINETELTTFFHAVYEKKIQDINYLFTFLLIRAHHLSISPAPTYFDRDAVHKDLPKQSWFGHQSWGLPQKFSWAQWGLIMPAVEELLRVLGLVIITKLNLSATLFGYDLSWWWAVIGYSLLHSIGHYAVDFHEGGAKLFWRRLPTRMALSALFGQSAYYVFTATNPGHFGLAETGGFFLVAVSFHIYYNVIAEAMEYPLMSQIQAKEDIFSKTRRHLINTFNEYGYSREQSTAIIHGMSADDLVRLTDIARFKDFIVQHPVRRDSHESQATDEQANQGFVRALLADLAPLTKSASKIGALKEAIGQSYLEDADQNEIYKALQPYVPYESRQKAQSIISRYFEEIESKNNNPITARAQFLSDLNYYFLIPQGIVLIDFSHGKTAADITPSFIVHHSLIDSAVIYSVVIADHLFNPENNNRRYMQYDHSHNFFAYVITQLLSNMSYLDREMSRGQQYPILTHIYFRLRLALAHMYPIFTSEFDLLIFHFRRIFYELRQNGVSISVQRGILKPRTSASTELFVTAAFFSELNAARFAQSPNVLLSRWIAAYESDLKNKRQTVEGDFARLAIKLLTQQKYKLDPQHEDEFIAFGIRDLLETYFDVESIDSVSLREDLRGRFNRLYIDVFGKSSEQEINTAAVQLIPAQYQPVLPKRNFLKEFLDGFIQNKKAPPVVSKDKPRVATPFKKDWEQKQIEIQNLKGNWDLFLSTQRRHIEDLIRSDRGETVTVVADLHEGIPYGTLLKRYRPLQVILLPGMSEQDIHPAIREQLYDYDEQIQDELIESISFVPANFVAPSPQPLIDLLTTRANTPAQAFQIYAEFLENNADAYQWKFLPKAFSSDLLIVTDVFSSVFGDTREQFGQFYTKRFHQSPPPHNIISIEQNVLAKATMKMAEQMTYLVKRNGRIVTVFPEEKFIGFPKEISRSVLKNIFKQFFEVMNTKIQNMPAFESIKTEKLSTVERGYAFFRNFGKQPLYAASELSLVGYLLLLSKKIVKKAVASDFGVHLNAYFGNRSWQIRQRNIFHFVRQLGPELKENTIVSQLSANLYEQRKTQSIFGGSLGWVGDVILSPVLEESLRWAAWNYSQQSLFVVVFLYPMVHMVLHFWADRNELSVAPFKTMANRVASSILISGVFVIGTYTTNSFIVGLILSTISHMWMNFSVLQKAQELMASQSISDRLSHQATLLGVRQFSFETGTVKNKITIVLQNGMNEQEQREQATLLAATLLLYGRSSQVVLVGTQKTKQQIQPFIERWEKSGVIIPAHFNFVDLSDINHHQQDSIVAQCEAHPITQKATLLIVPADMEPLQRPDYVKTFNDLFPISKKSIQTWLKQVRQTLIQA